MRPQVRFEKTDTVASFFKKKELEGVRRKFQKIPILTFHQHNSLILQFIGQVYAAQIKGV